MTSKMIPTLSPTEVPKGTPTEGQEVSPSSTHAITPFSLSNIPPLIESRDFFVANSAVNPLFKDKRPDRFRKQPDSPPTSKRKPPQIDYDPDAIFGGDFDVDFYDYSDDDDDENISLLDLSKKHGKHGRPARASTPVSATEVKG